MKFSRDFDNPRRDLGRTQMEPEVRFASLSRARGFPIAVPTVQFADYDRSTGTGILITERIPFGRNGIERQYHKCLDYDMPECLEHYRALLTALARLAGADRAGRLPAHPTAHFPLDLRAATVGKRAPLCPDTMERRLTELTELVATSPGLLPANVGSPQFLTRLRGDVPRVAQHDRAIAQWLAADADCVALCHWNANVDNARFWRDAAGTLRCGGPRLDPERLRRHTVLYAAAMGVSRLLDVPALIRKRFGAAAPSSRMDPRIRDDESVRAPLQMLSNLLSLWERPRWVTYSINPAPVIPCVTVVSVVTSRRFLSVGLRMV